MTKTTETMLAASALAAVMLAAWVAVQESVPRLELVPVETCGGDADCQAPIWDDGDPFRGIMPELEV